MSKMKKLFVSWDGSDPDCYEDFDLCLCLGQMLGCMHIGDELVQYVLEDMHTFATEEADEEGRIKKKFLSACMSCSAEWCYGYNSFWEAFNDDN